MGAWGKQKNQHRITNENYRENERNRNQTNQKLKKKRKKKKKKRKRGRKKKDWKDEQREKNKQTRQNKPSSKFKKKRKKKKKYYVVTSATLLLLQSCWKMISKNRIKKKKKEAAQTGSLPRRRIFARIVMGRRRWLAEQHKIKKNMKHSLSNDIKQYTERERERWREMMERKRHKFKPEGIFPWGSLNWHAIHIQEMKDRESRIED